MQVRLLAETLFLGVRVRTKYSIYQRARLISYTTKCIVFGKTYFYRRKATPHGQSARSEGGQKDAASATPNVTLVSMVQFFSRAAASTDRRDKMYLRRTAETSNYAPRRCCSRTAATAVTAPKVASYRKPHRAPREHQRRRATPRRTAPRRRAKWHHERQFRSVRLPPKRPRIRATDHGPDVA